MLVIDIVLAAFLLIISFFVSFFLTKWWIKTAKGHVSMLQPDMNKYNKKILVPKTGGIVVAISFVVATFIYIFFKTFILHSVIHTTEILTITITLLLACFVAFIDDIFGWEKSSISGYKKILMTIPIAIPLMIINAGHSVINLPFLGNISLWIVYPLVIIPLSIVGTTNGFNMLAGFNGLESGLGIIIFSTLGLISLITGQKWLALIAGIMVFVLIAFFIFNKVPAKIFPGNTLTYIIGALIGCFAIAGNMEKSAFILFVPFIIEGFLKLRSKFKAHNFGIPNKDNSLEPRYPKIYSLTHFALRVLKKIKPSHKVYENDVVYFIFIIEIILALFVIFNTFFHFI